jgi:integrase/recombinase XerC
MASRSKRVTAENRVDVDAPKVCGRYERWLARQPLAGRTRDAYAAQGTRFVDWLAGSEHGGAALVEAHVRDWAVRDYKRHVEVAKRWSPASVNQALAGIDNFYRFLGVGRPEVAREDLPAVAPRALDEGKQRAFLRAVETWPSARDRAIATVLFYTGLRLSELAALDVDDLSVSERRGRLLVRTEKSRSTAPAARRSTSGPPPAPMSSPVTMTRRRPSRCRRCGCRGPGPG